MVIWVFFPFSRMLSMVSRLLACRSRQAQAPKRWDRNEGKERVSGWKRKRGRKWDMELQGKARVIDD